ncbi:hypothetical protein [Stenoxybacter acetivorans]|uniref:hypothetical protein n=1 Tax=Stenoxybacter acetivorans TaxID=422441 RepID=UPI00056450F8|nr:hypothetical protein [Stenoxybacter acetivorans]
MWGNITLWALAAYISIFVLQCLRYRQWLWLIGAVLCWWIMADYSSLYLPGVLGSSHLANLYIPSLYITLSSPLALRKHNQSNSVYLSYLASSGWVMLAAFSVLLGLILMRYPNGISLYSLLSLLGLFFGQPIFYLGCQWLLMLLWYLNRDHIGAEKYKVSYEIGFLLMVLWFFGYVLCDLSGYV